LPDLWTDLLGCLQLRARDGEPPGASDVSVFEGANQQLNYHRLFGGQLLGQFIRAASATCPDKAIKSLHAVFAKKAAPTRAWFSMTKPCAWSLALPNRN